MSGDLSLDRYSSVSFTGEECHPGLVSNEYVRHKMYLIHNLIERGKTYLPVHASVSSRKYTSEIPHLEKELSEQVFCNICVVLSMEVQWRTALLLTS